MERPSVLVLAKTGYIIRDILLGTFTDELLSHLDLIVAVPDPNDESLRKLAAGKPISYIPFFRESLPQTKREQYLGATHWLYRFKQIERDNPSLEIVTRLYEPSLSGKREYLVRGATLAGKVVDRLGLMGVAEQFFLEAIARREITRQWTDVLAQLNPAAIVSTALTLPEGFFGVSADLPVLLAAHRVGIPSGSLIQSWDNLSSKTYILPPWLDRFWTWSETMSEELFFYNPRICREKVRIVGSPHFDFHRIPTLQIPRQEFVPTLGMNPNHPYVVIGTGTRKLLPDEPKTVTSLVRRLRGSYPQLQILLRVHPKDVASRWSGHFDELRKLGAVIQKPIPDKPMDSGGFTTPQQFFCEQINTLRHAAVVINTASSLTVDAAILDTPVISLGYDLTGSDTTFPEGRSWFYNRSAHFGPLVETGGVWVVDSEEVCVAAVESYLLNRDLHQEQRCQIAHKVGGPLDGEAGTRLAHEVVCLALEQPSSRHVPQTSQAIA